MQQLPSRPTLIDTGNAGASAANDATVLARQDLTVQALADTIRRQRYAVFDASLLEPARLGDLADVQASFATLAHDPAPGNRQRAHSYYTLAGDGNWVVGTTPGYYQPAATNPDGAGAVRVYAPIAPAVLASSTVKHLLEFHTTLARAVDPALFEGGVVADLHCVRYNATRGKPGFAMPAWVHVDMPERYVAVVLFGLTANLIGGDNVIARDDVPIDVIRLTAPLDTIVLYQQVPHCVTPQGSADEAVAMRDALLLTFRAA